MCRIGPLQAAHASWYDPATFIRCGTGKWRYDKYGLNWELDEDGVKHYYHAEVRNSNRERGECPSRSEYLIWDVHRCHPAHLAFVRRAPEDALRCGGPRSHAILHPAHLAPQTSRGDVLRIRYVMFRSKNWAHLC